jgi:hypothetical protein
VPIAPETTLKARAYHDRKLGIKPRSCDGAYRHSEESMLPVSFPQQIQTGLMVNMVLAFSL